MTVIYNTYIRKTKNRGGEMNRLNQEQLDFLSEDSRQEGDTSFGYRLLEIELETMFGFDLYTDEYEGRI